MIESPEVWRMRIAVDAASQPAPVWPAGVTVRSFTPHDGPALHALLAHSYRHGGGTVGAFQEWFTQTTTDDEFDPQVCFLAESGTFLAGAALCWSSAFVKDLAVHESWRRRGLGEALLRHAFTTFASRGARAVELKVEATNSNAVRLYQRVGMRVVERITAGARNHP